MIKRLITGESENFINDCIWATNVYPKASVRKSWAKMTEKLMENELYAA